MVETSFNDFVVRLDFAEVIEMFVNRARAHKEIFNKHLKEENHEKKSFNTAYSI
jgi:hypothetical protein